MRDASGGDDYTLIIANNAARDRSKLYFQSLESQGNKSDLLSLRKIYFLVDREPLLLLIRELVLRQYSFKSQLTAFISV